MPEATLLAFAEHGDVGAAMPADGGDSEAVLAQFAKAGIDITALSHVVNFDVPAVPEPGTLPYSGRAQLVAYHNSGKVTHAHHFAWFVGGCWYRYRHACCSVRFRTSYC